MSVEMLKGQVAVANLMLSEKELQGVLSAIDRETNTVAVCPTGVSFVAENMLLLKLDSEQHEDRCYPEDLQLHLSLYRQNPGAKWVAHVYPKYASAFADAGKEIPLYRKQQAAWFPRRVGCLRESKPLGGIDDELKTLFEADCTAEEGAVLLHGDGALVWNQTMQRTLDLADRLETAAETAFYATKLGAAEELPAELSKELFLARKEKENRVSRGVPGDPVTLEDQKKINMELLVYFDQVCRANGIKYSVTGGTLLGAIRHADFIPWDDDVDVFMTRPEYDKLAAAFPDDARFIYMDQTKDPNYNFAYGRILDTSTYIADSPGTRNAGTGLFLDISPVDGLPKSALLRVIHMKYMRVLYRCRRATMYNPKNKHYADRGPLFVLMKKIVRRFTTHHFWNRLMEKGMKRYRFDSSQYVGNFTSQYGDRELLHRADFDSYIDVTIDGHQFMACKGYDEYLSNLHRNYMELPPIGSRKGHHVYTAFWVK